MNTRWVWTAGLLLGLAGCCHHRNPCPPPPCCPTPGRPLPPGTIFPGPAAPAQPAPAAPVPETPPPAWPSGAAPPPAASVPAVRNYPPVAAVAPQSNGVRTEPPMAPPAAPQLGRPEPAVAESRAPGPQASATPALPAGIPQFAYVGEKVAAGQRPQPEDGFDWLQANGFRTVVFVRRPGEDETADRREVLKRGMKYQTLTYAPQTLSRQVLDEFNRLITDPAGQPVFVYDRNGAWAGSLWYLHFRTVARLSDEEARRRAGQLGLRPLEDSEQRTLWVAMQKLLAGTPQ